MLMLVRFRVYAPGLSCRRLRHLDELGERCRGGLGPLLVDQAVGAVEVDEGDRGLPMLGLDRSGREVLADRLRHAEREVASFEHRRRVQANGLARDRRLQQPAWSLGFAEKPFRKRASRRLAEQDLAGLRGIFQADCRRRAGPGDQELAVGVPDEEEVEGAAVDADVHPERHVARRRARPPDLAQRPAHPVRRTRGADGVTVAGEEEQECVAAELEEAASLPVGDVEQVRERVVHHLRHLLRAHLPLAGEAFGHRGEAGEVDERERPVERLPAHLRLRLQPVRNEPRHVGAEVGRGRPSGDSGS
jgi:hypothetical protein